MHKLFFFVKVGLLDNNLSATILPEGWMNTILKEFTHICNIY